MAHHARGTPSRFMSGTKYRSLKRLTPKRRRNAPVVHASPYRMLDDQLQRAVTVLAIVAAVFVAIALVSAP